MLTSKDFVSFKEIEGMRELINCLPSNTKIKGNIIEIEDISNFSDYKRGGVLYNIKIPKILNFESFKKKEKNMKFLWIF